MDSKAPSRWQHSRKHGRKKLQSSNHSVLALYPNKTFQTFFKVLFFTQVLAFRHFYMSTFFLVEIEVVWSTIVYFNLWMNEWVIQSNLCFTDRNLFQNIKITKDQGYHTDLVRISPLLTDYWFNFFYERFFHSILY